MNIIKSKLLLIATICAFISGCVFSGSKGTLAELTTEVNGLQNSKQVKMYAPAEMKQAEDSLIAAVKAWNAGRRDESMELAELTRQRIKIAQEVTKKEAALGLSDEAWEQRRWLREVRAKRLTQTN